MSRTRVWIVGAEGNLGSTVYHEIDHEEYSVVTSDKDVDITDIEQVTRYIDVNRPDVVINCAGIVQMKNDEEDLLNVYRVNTLGARNLAIATRKTGAKIIHISSDDVFSGIGAGELDEFDIAVPDTPYGKSKLAAETMIRELNPKHLIVRSSWVYGGGKSEDFVGKVLRLAKENQKVQAPNDQISAPTSCKELARFLVCLIDEKEYGVFHASCEGSCTRYDFAKAILEQNGMDSSQVEPIFSGQQAKCTKLRNLMMELTGIYQMPTWQKALKDYFTQTN